MKIKKVLTKNFNYSYKLILMLLCTLALWLGLASANLVAQALTDGAEIARRSFALPSPTTVSMKVQLLLLSPEGSRRAREVELTKQEGPFAEKQVHSKQFLKFISPKDVAGTKFLSFNKSQQGERKKSFTETRMFTPGDQKIRVIASSSKKNSFMGTDFSYYDLEEHNFEDFAFEFIASAQEIADQSFAGRLFYKVKATPHDRSAPYDSMIYWIDQQSYQVRYIEAFASGSKVKDIFVLKNVANSKYFIPQVLLAVNHKKNGHRTVWNAQKVLVNPTIEPRTFTIQNLR